jgi:ABC-type polysaccharide/polyol phosphate transport system ATPase subunit
MSTEQPMVIVKNLYKTFKLPHEQHSGVKQRIVNVFKNKKGYEIQKVLKDINFEIPQGEFFGIVGRNGSGKSTLLKLLAGIYAADKGEIHIGGSLTPFIELGVGFNPELTGRENVFMNGALLGFGKTEMEKMYNEIVSFAELEKFMDQKLKNYSSGMQVRLAFSIAIKAQSDILLIDEVLAVGDAAFQKKCFDYFMKLKKDKKTVILVTHDMSAVRQYCDQAIMIDKGEIVERGDVETVAQAYQKLFNDEIASTTAIGSDDERRWGSGRLVAQRPTIDISDEKIIIQVSYKAHDDIEPPIFGFNIYNSRGMNILEGNTMRKKMKTRAMKKNDQVELEWEFSNMLASDTYTLSVSCCDKSMTEFYDWYNEAVRFVIAKQGNTAGFVDPILTLHELEYK